MVVLPLVPVTPTTVSAALGSPASRAAAGPRSRRGASATTTADAGDVDRVRRDDRARRRARPPRATCAPPVGLRAGEREEEVARPDRARVDRDARRRRRRRRASSRRETGARQLAQTHRREPRSAAMPHALARGEAQREAAVGGERRAGRRRLRCHVARCPSTCDRPSRRACARVSASRSERPRKLGVPSGAPTAVGAPLDARASSARGRPAAGGGARGAAASAGAVGSTPRRFSTALGDRAEDRRRDDAAVARRPRLVDQHDDHRARRVGRHEADERADPLRRVAARLRVHLLRRTRLAGDREVVEPRLRTRAALLLDDARAGASSPSAPSRSLTTRRTDVRTVLERAPRRPARRRAARGTAASASPPLAIAANAAAICSGVTETPCPKLCVARSMRAQLSTGRRMPGVSPGQLDAGALAEAEGAEIAVVALAPEPLADLARADVARVLDHLGEREPAVRMGVVDRPLADRDSGRSRRRTSRSASTTRSSIAAAARTALKVEPGS